MATISDLFEKIKERNEKYGITMPNSITEEAILDFTNKFSSIFEIEPDQGYINFLKLSNGLEENGFVVFPSEEQVLNDITYIDFFKYNQLLRVINNNYNYIYYADSEEASFAYDKNENVFFMISNIGGRKIREFTNFEELILYILNEMIN